MKENKSSRLEDWSHEVNKTSNDMISWALDRRTEDPDKKPEQDKGLSLTRTHIALGLIALLILTIGFWIGYKVGIDIATNHFEPIITVLNSTQCPWLN